MLDWCNHSQACVLILDGLHTNALSLTATVAIWA